MKSPGHRGRAVLGLALAAFGCSPKDGPPPVTAGKPAAPAVAPAGDAKQTAPVAAPREADEVAASCLYVDRCLERLQAEPEGELLGDRVASIVQSAERTLPAFWGTDPRSLAPELRKKIDDYPARIRGWVDRINEKKSQQALGGVRGWVANHERWRAAHPDMPWQNHIEHAEIVIRQVQTLVAGMSAGPALDEAGKLLLAEQKFLNGYGRQQLTAYQKKALAASHQFVTFVLTNTVTRDSVLLAEFEKAEVGKVDAGLLGADARRMYDTALGFMNDKLKDRTRADFLLKLTETEKWPLNDF